MLLGKERETEIEMQKEERIEYLLEKLGLYQRDWVGYEKVIKQLSNDYTIFIKENNTWEWYNEKDFNAIKCDNNLKKELIKLLKPKNGYLEY